MTTFDYSFSKPLHGEAVYPLFQQTSWAANRTPAQIQTLLDNTLINLGVWDDEKLIGFARVITDDLTRAFIEDVVVDSAYRSQGVGHGILEALLKRLAHVEELILCCEVALIPFYESVGFQVKNFTFMNKWQG